jgi:hypothetical protein
MSNDKDGDGKVSKEEASGLPEALFTNNDTNNDGFLDKAEMDAMRARFKSGGGQGGGMRNLMSNDKNKDGKVSRDEAPEGMQNFFDRMDANGDGFIDQAELDARRGGGGGGGGGGFGGGGFGGPPK